jgi:hypothetical protein
MHKFETLFKKMPKAKRDRGVTQVVEHLPGKHKALNSTPVLQRRKKKILPLQRIFFWAFLELMLLPLCSHCALLIPLISLSIL